MQIIRCKLFSDVTSQHKIVAKFQSKEEFQYDQTTAYKIFNQ